MTCIISIVDKNKNIWMGADSLASCSSGDIEDRKDKKLFIKDDFIFGFCGSYRVGQLLQYRLDIPENKENKTIEEYMNTDFIDEVRMIFTKYGCSKKEDNVEEVDSAFIVGHNGKLFKVAEDFQVGIPLEDYTATGSGESQAFGVLYVTKDMNLTPKKRIIKGLEAAEKYNAYVRRPFNILTLKWED